MELDFSNVDDAQDFKPLPEGRYPCRVVSSEQSSTSNGNPKIRLSLEVLDGPYTGRRIFDDLVLSGGAMGRVKLALSRMGFDTTGRLEFEPEDLIDRRVIVDVVFETYTNKETGDLKTVNKVPFAGYHVFDPKDLAPVSGSASAPAGREGGEGGAVDEPMPF